MFKSSFEIVNKNIFDSEATAILHQVNCKGVMGSGIAKQVRQRYPIVFKEYSRMCKQATKNGQSSDLLGEILVSYKTSSFSQNLIDDQLIVNLFAQDNYGYDGQYTDYEALRKCLIKVNNLFKGSDVAIPYMMSCTRGGGDWEVVDKIISETLKDCKVTYYKYNNA